mgnify:CR=1 FL=1
MKRQAEMTEKIYTLPFECETLGLFYDADALEEEGIEPPKTWEELKSAAEKLTTKDRYGIVLPVEKTAYTLFNWWPFMWMDDADIYDADGKCNGRQRQHGRCS